MLKKLDHNSAPIHNTKQNLSFLSKSKSLSTKQV